MHIVVAVLLFVVGLINFAPVVAVTSTARVRAMYGVDVASRDLEVLLRHRAVLFGIVGALILVSSFVSELRTFAIGAGFVNMLSFVALAATTEHNSAFIRKIVIADLIGSALLCGAVIVMVTSRTL